MINAQQANKQATDNFVPNLKGSEKMLHFYIEAKIRERSEIGYYDVRINRSEVDKLWYDLHGGLSIARLLDYYQQLGYSIFPHYEPVNNQFVLIMW
ncbi:hypothetical protein Ln8_0043 [Leuconostoc phage Ln-8]|uniref:Uncharacterized protein n=2 Tax=Unaquatrovirus TaxID=2169622 RepID=A0A0D3MKG5_9CAUD|nr:hypothetical protein ACQ48_gp43 [Leuconostoc phage Ln-8]YP_010080416.1 hypothetical protein KMC76_gp45 [Leuconostoc phage Ln-7]AIM50940.1 hypothetical protein Ln8_0043 [Leuconostoc phage Ln-8]AOT27913.1 hypothetical protein [Leuconostoc phage Ln-7]